MVKGLENEMNKKEEKWTVSEELRRIAEAIYNSGKYENIIAPLYSAFFLTNVKKIKSKGLVVKAVDSEDLLAKLLGEQKFVVAIDQQYYNNLSFFEKIYTMTFALHQMALNEDSNPKIIKPDINEFKEMVKADFINAAPINAIAVEVFGKEADKK